MNVIRIKFFKSLLAVFALIVINSCSVEAEKINYGKDQCGFCSMNIVDETHAAQYVTAKGKQFKFDAIECMLNDITAKSDVKFSTILIADYSNPGKMINAENAIYLISEKIQSPMGGNLSAFSTQKKADEARAEYTGEIYSWEELKTKFKEKHD